MTKLNPFDYGGPVSGDLFAGREREVAAVVSRLRDHIGVMVTAPRRYGKSSLIKQATEKLAEYDPAPAIVHVNLLQAGSLTAATELLVRRLYHVPGGPWHRLKNVLPGFLKRLRVQPTMTIDATGNPVFTFTPSVLTTDLQMVVDDVYATLDEIGVRRPTVLFLDEFQAAIDLDAHLPRQLKALADEHRNVSLVLAGSKQHVMESLVLSQGAPLYKMLEQIALGQIPEDDWVPFLLRRARGAGRPFTDEALARNVYGMAGPVPFDVQQLAYEAFNQASKTINRATLDVALSELVLHRANDYATTFEGLSAGRRRVLKVLAAGTGATSGSAEFAVQVGLASSSSVHKALNQLTELELLVQRGGEPVIEDPFFAAWLRGVLDNH